MPMSLQAIIWVCIAGLFGGCTSHREPVVILDPVFSVARDFMVDAAEFPAREALLTEVIAGADTEF